MTPEEAYTKITKLAREHALISAAAGGVVVIMHPDTQRDIFFKKLFIDNTYL